MPWSLRDLYAGAGADARARARAGAIRRAVTLRRHRAASVAETDLAHFLGKTIDAPDRAVILEVLVSKKELKE
jgi:hypothetical protein